MNHFKEMQQSIMPLSKAYQGRTPKSNGLRVITDINPLIIDGKPWRHVSVSRASRCPSHEDMMLVKSEFLDEDQVVLSIYPKKEEWVNAHEYCLHLWQPIGFDPVPDPLLERAAAVGPLMNGSVQVNRTVSRIVDHLKKSSEGT